MNSSEIEKKHVIVGTAGHIDHGKTALVKALTGIDADTLLEEKRRGITIELGFVFLDAPQCSKQVVFIDVPGHEKLVKTMVAGASNIDAALLVIAADEGINVQTREHFEILQLLGIRQGIVALTKSDLVDHERRESLCSQIRDYVRGTFLEKALILCASAQTGEGIPELKQALVDMGNSVEDRTDRGVFRMPVDRVFTMSGFGTVIAGTVLSGEVRIGDRLEIFPEKMTSRVRGIQVHHSRVERSYTGSRTALNLPEIKKERLKRGQVAALPGVLFPTQRLDGRLLLLKSFGRELKNRMRVRLHVGTAEVICRIVLLDKEILNPGESALVQFVLESPVVALPGDRFVIRSFSPVLTIGGGTVLDGFPEKHKRMDPHVSAGLQSMEKGLESQVEQSIRNAGMRSQSVLHTARLLGQSPDKLRGVVGALTEKEKLVRIEPGGGQAEKTELFLHARNFAALKEAILEEMTVYLGKNPYQPAMPLAELKTRLARWTDSGAYELALQSLVGEKKATTDEGRVGPAGYQITLSAKDSSLAEQIEEAFRQGDVIAPLESEVRERFGLPEKTFSDILDVLIRQGRLVRLDAKVIYHAHTLHKVQGFVIEYIRRQGSITLAELRDALKFSRKYAQPILEYLDRVGLTQRVGDKRILNKDGKV